MTRDYARSLVEGLQGDVDGSAQDGCGSCLPMPTEILFMNRLQFGFYSVLARLDVAVDYAASKPSS
jgi:hypothetical protein